MKTAREVCEELRQRKITGVINFILENSGKVTIKNHREDKGKNILIKTYHSRGTPTGYNFSVNTVIEVVEDLKILGYNVSVKKDPAIFHTVKFISGFFSNSYEYEIDSENTEKIEITISACCGEK